jgi:hypothetical protein
MTASCHQTQFKALIGRRRSPGPLLVGFGRQEIHFVLGGNADDFGDIGQVMN